MQKRSNFLYSFIFFLTLSLFVAVIYRVSFVADVVNSFQLVLLPLQRIVYGSFQALAAEEESSVVKNLKEQNASLVKQLVIQKQMQQELTALKDQYATTKLTPKHLLPAMIVGMRTFIPGVSVPEEITVDKGKSDGVKVGTVAVYKDSLIGQVVSSSSHVSLIQLIANEHTSFTAKSLQNNAYGIIKGQGRGEILLDNVVLSDKLEKGDIILTKGDIGKDGSGYPPDLTVGKIVSIDKKPSNLFQTAEIESIVDVTQLTTVFLLQ